MGFQSGRRPANTVSDLQVRRVFLLRHGEAEHNVSDEDHFRLVLFHQETTFQQGLSHPEPQNGQLREVH